jgi:hypothetical protein
MHARQLRSCRKPCQEANPMIAMIKKQNGGILLWLVYGCHHSVEKWN